MILNPLDRRVTEQKGFPVLPGAFPVVGHLPSIATDYLTLLRHAERTLGSFFCLNSGFGRVQLTCVDPDVFTILKNKTTTSTYIQDFLPDLFGISLIAQDGPVHRHMRSAMDTPFLPRGLTAAEVGPLLADIIDRRVRSWRDREVRILAETREMVLAIMFRLLGVPETNLDQWREHYEEFMLLAINFPLDLPGLPQRRGKRARAWLDEHLRAFVRDARAQPKSTGLLAALVAGRDDGGAELTEAELIDNLRLLVLAGHETSASTMAWMVIELAQRPEVWDAVCEEATKVGGIPQSPKEIRALPYTEAVFRETLRLHPPVAFDARRATTDFELAGRTIPKDEMVNIAIVHLSRHPSLYEDGDSFLPARWTGKATTISPLEMVQFGGGPHFCLGYHLAWMEIVQFGAALALAMREKGLRPKLAGRRPREVYLPLLHPSSGTRIAFA